MTSPAITISSSNDIITIKSSRDDDDESMRVPVSEERLNKSSDRICNEKVNNWLTDPRNSHVEYSPDTVRILKMHDYCIRNEEVQCNDEKNNTLVVKCDFENNTSVVVNDSPLRMKQTNGNPMKNSTKTSVSLETLLGKALGNIFKRNDKETNIISDTNVTRKFKIRNICFKYNSPPKLHTDEEKKNVPMSPESQKKKELCTYLKLMNPADKKENVHVVKSRRYSARVKRALERKQYPTMQSFEDLNIKVERKSLLSYKKVLFEFPPPPKRFTDTVEDFDDVVEEFMERPKTPQKSNGIKEVLKFVKRDKKLLNRIKMREHKKKWRKKYELRNKKLKIRRNVERKRELVKNKLLRNVGNVRTLRSRRNLKNINIRRILLRNNNVKKKMKPKNKLPNTEKFVEERTVEKNIEENDEQTISNCEMTSIHEKQLVNNCEIISVAEIDEDVNDLDDELKKLDELSDENKRVLVESCILPAKTPVFDLTTGKMSPMFGFSSNDIKTVQEICDLYKKYEPHDENMETNERIEAADSTVIELNANILDHDYLNPTEDEEDSEDDDSVEEDENKFIIPKMTYEEFDPPSTETTILENPTSFQPYNDDKITIKSLHRNLMQSKQRRPTTTNYWNGFNKKNEQQTISSTNSSHSIYINRENGPVLNAFYFEQNLIICQEHGVSFWEQSALGNILNAQNMWLPKGHIERLVFNNKYVQKKSKEMIISMETSVALVELWTKEHKSELRERPVADVFATVYFWKHRQTGLDKKVIQLENIKGFADDVQYIVSRYSPKIIVSWNSSQQDDKTKKRTHIHAYQLASDYQTVANIYEIQSVAHYIASLHNIEDCSYLIMGCGESKITVWNMDYGNILATIDMSTIESPLATLWVKSDRGFLFTLQECENNELRLIAINGLNHSWKRLATYNPPMEFNRLKGVYFDEGILVSFYDKDILCWNVENSELIVQETFNGTEIIPSGKYVIMINNNQVIVRNTITYLYIE